MLNLGGHEAFIEMSTQLESPIDPLVSHLSMSQTAHPTVFQ